MQISGLDSEPKTRAESPSSIEAFHAGMDARDDGRSSSRLEALSDLLSKQRGQTFVICNQDSVNSAIMLYQVLGSNLGAALISGAFISSVK